MNLSRSKRLCLCATVLLTLTGATHAVEVVLVNDSAGVNPSTAAVFVGFSEGEVAAAVFDPAANNPPIGFPFTVKRVQIYWRNASSSPFIPTPPRTEGAIVIYQGTTVTLLNVNPGTLVRQCDSPCLQDSATGINEFDLENVDNECPPPIITSGPKIAVGIRFGSDPIECGSTADPLPRRSLSTCANFCNAGCPTLPSVVRDAGRKPLSNIVFAINACGTPEGWYSSDLLGVQGDWIIRAVVEAANLLPPVITSIFPTSAVNTGPISIAINGANFLPNNTAAVLSRTGQPSIGGTNLNVTNGGTLLEATFDITGAALGPWTLTVSTPNGSDVLTDGFTVGQAPAPTITDIQPATSPNNQVVHCTITGTDFVTGATSVSLTRVGSTINGTNVVVSNSTSLTADFNLVGVPTGFYSVNATTANGNGTAGDAFFVEALAAPQVFGADVSDSTNCPGNLVLSIFGQAFQPNAIALLSRAGQPDLQASTTVFVDNTNLTATFNPAGIATGNWNIKVRNPDLQTAESNPLDYVLSVTGCIPAITNVAPTSANNHQAAQAFTVTGSNFVTGCTVKLTQAGQPDITATGVSVINGGQTINCTINLYLVNTGLWSVTVSNPGGGQFTASNAFTVVPGPAPVVSLVTPGSPDNCDPWTATINGSNYLVGAAAKLVLAGQPDIVGTSVIRLSATQLQATFDLTGVATTPTSDKWDCIVTNPDGQSGTGVNRVNVVACSVSCLKGDLNNDTIRNGDDIQAFVRVLIQQTGTPVEMCAADLVAGGGINSADVDAFVNCLTTGTCP